MIRQWLETEAAFQSRQAQLLAASNAREEERLPPSKPRVVVLRHKKIEDPERLPSGTRMRAWWEQTNEWRARYEAAQRELSQAQELCARAQQSLDQMDPEAAPDRYAAAAARLRSLQSQVTTLSEKVRQARQQFELAQSEWRLAYSAYERLVAEVNAIPPLDRPLLPGERIEDRAKEHGRVAELEYLLKAMLQPEPVSSASRVA